MAQGSFSAQVSAWVAETKERQEAVYRESIQRVIEVMQTPISSGGNMPVATGFLRASLQAAIGDGLPPLSDKPEGPGRFSYDAGQVNLVIANATINDKVTAAFGASYASFQEYGSHGRSGRRFVGLAAQQWPQIVEKVSAEAQTRAGRG